jgi:hypothetical protein
MQPAYKEDPREWKKFVLTTGVPPVVLALLLWWKGAIPAGVAASVFAAVILADVACLIRARWFRGYYRAGTYAGFHLARFLGGVALGLVFFLVVTPMGLALRCKDLLELRRNRRVGTYWKQAPPRSDLDRMF